jgi:hypothetical protein
MGPGSHGGAVQVTKQINTWYKDGITNQMAGIDKHYDALVR